MQRVLKREVNMQRFGIDTPNPERRKYKRRGYGISRPRRHHTMGLMLSSGSGRPFRTGLAQRMRPMEHPDIAGSPQSLRRHHPAVCDPAWWEIWDPLRKPEGRVLHLAGWRKEA